MSKQVDLMSLTAKLGLNVAKFEKGVGQANRAMDRMDKRMKKSAKSIQLIQRNLAGVAAGIAAAFSVRAIANFTKAAIAAGDRVDKMSQTVGLSAESFQKLAGAAELSGVNVALFESSMTAFVKRIGEAQNGMGPLVSGLKNMDQALLDSLANAKNQEDAFDILANAYQKLETEAERAALMNAAFGRSGIKMGNMMREGARGLKEMSSEFDVISNENVRLAAELTDKWTIFFGNFQSGMYNTVIGSLSDLNDYIGSGNLAQSIDDLGERWSFVGDEADIAISAMIDLMGAGTDDMSADIDDFRNDVKEAFEFIPEKMKAMIAIVKVEWSYFGGIAATAAKDITNAFRIEFVALLDYATGIGNALIDALNPFGGTESVYANIDEANRKRMAAQDQRVKDYTKTVTTLDKTRLKGITAAIDGMSEEIKTVEAQEVVNQSNLDLVKAERAEREAALKVQRDALATGIKAVAANKAARGGGGGGSSRAESDALIRENEKIAASYQQLRGELDPLIGLQQAFVADMKTVTDEIDRLGGATDEHISVIQRLKDEYENARESASAWADIMTSAAQDLSAGMADTLVQGIMDGKMAFEEMALSFLSNIAKMIIQAQILAAISSAMGAFGIGGAKAAPKSLAYASPGITQFGAASAPRLYDPSASLRTSSASRGEVSVQVNNYADATVKTTSQKDDSGNVKISLMIENVMKDAFGSGRMDRSLSGSYGLRRQPA